MNDPAWSFDRPHPAIQYRGHSKIEAVVAPADVVRQARLGRRCDLGARFIGNTRSGQIWRDCVGVQVSNL